MALFFSCIFPHSSAANEEMWCNEIEPTVLAQMLIITLLTFTGALSRRKRERRANKQSTVPRVRRSVSDLMRELGEYYEPRAYRMSGQSFWVLHAMLLPKIEYYLKRKQSRRSNKRKRGARNGLISTSIRLSCTIRYFASGCPYDISLSHGISVTEVSRVSGLLLMLLTIAKS